MTHEALALALAKAWAGASHPWLGARASDLFDAVCVRLVWTEGGVASNIVDQRLQVEMPAPGVDLDAWFGATRAVLHGREGLWPEELLDHRLWRPGHDQAAYEALLRNDEAMDRCRGGAMLRAWGEPDDPVLAGVLYRATNPDMRCDTGVSMAAQERLLAWRSDLWDRYHQEPDVDELPLSGWQDDFAAIGTPWT